MKRVFPLAFAAFASCQGVVTAPRAPTFAIARVEPASVATLGARAGGTITIVHIGKSTIAYVADEDDRTLRTFDIDDERELSAFPLDGAPAQIVTMPNDRVAVALRDRASVEIVEGSGGPGSAFRKIASIDTPDDPVGLARSPDDKSLLVASGWGHALSVFDAATYERRALVDLGREPRAVAVSDDGKKAFVSHAAGDALSVIDLEHPNAKVKAWRLESESWAAGFRMMPTGPFMRKSNNANAIAISEEPAGRVFVAHALSHTTAGDANSDVKETVETTGYGGGELGANDVFDLAVVDEKKGEPMDFEPRPMDDQVIVRVAREEATCLVPRAAVTFGAKLFVACVDTSRVLELDAGWFHPDSQQTRVFDVPSGPVGLAVDTEGSRLVVWSQFARKITLLPAASDATFTLASFRVHAEHPLDATLARGREIFHTQSRKISDDGRVCASCHPDGRDDGLVWTTNEGPRQTPMLAGRLDGSAPYGWRGTAIDVPTHLKTTLKRLGGTGLDDGDRDALVAWLRAMPAPRSHVDETLARRGETIFQSKEAACATCHGIGGDLPDGERHNVMSWAQGDKIGIFDTPSLRSVGGTAPYFHDGRYKDLRTLLVSVDGTMGHTKQLAPSDLDALETYLRSL